MGSEFNETDFPEYDSTPYGGGYDISATYGKPLPPSDIICYPRSLPNHNSFSPRGKDWNPSYGSTPPSNNNDSRDQRDFDTPVVPNIAQESPQFGNDYIPNGYNNPSEETPHFGNDYTPYGYKIPSEETPYFGNGYITDGYNNPSEETPQYGYDDSANGYNYPRDENGYYDYGRQVPVPPNDYVEPCASLFGYWPCLLKDYQKNVAQQGCSEQGYGTEWKRTEEYFFGSSYPSWQTRDDGVSQVDFNYGYERHYVEQPNYVQEEYNPQLWSQQLNYSYYESYQDS